VLEEAFAYMTGKYLDPYTYITFGGVGDTRNPLNEQTVQLFLHPHIRSLNFDYAVKIANKSVSG
jgi:hypothetical protein